MARRGSALLAVAIAFLGLWALSTVTTSFVQAPAEHKVLRGSTQDSSADTLARAGVAGLAIATIPQAASAATAGYAVLQVGWALFFIALGPAFLLWVYFNKPELL
mmetsp:Transcript_69046/g.165655  ORF Transcript_69046/g.165655 Transcript_69046/m.165655 type:complete len:105 (+) Transcript_69046:105-419(+)|eukprot:CAMPEP_0178401726 /NCGR_PEP_ID=MMETSP0689_2-20121128/16454_1 /TAXON_ID=160604 /ORGANISM="Amphidinium massartii, Strain CS-259" /LENGTH=104 /DNA_ID=CAMNT_0020022563 /DNA_START=87 /DNA_END=401 /DNA_ORIENTATION=+